MSNLTTLLKKGSAVALAGVLCAGLVPDMALDASAAVTTSTITCDISQGDVIIGNTAEVSGNGDTIIYTDENGELHENESISSKTRIVITGSTTEHTVMVRDYDNAPINITFKDLTIDVSAVPDEEGTGYVSTCAVYFGGESTSWPQGKVNLTLEGENVIKSLDYAGIAVPQGETVTIDGDGSLDVCSVTGNASVSAPGIGAPVSNNNPPEYISNEKYDTSFGKIIINGGTITATSDCAAIGGGQGCTTGTIVINGGNITATAGIYSSAGIGCGQDSDIGSILITGGTIVATGSNSGPGIGGGGMHTDSGIITITGGDITATGGNYAPGIGGSGTNGYGHGYANQIRISGGTIRSYGGYTAAGIGAGGPYGLADDITISGGTVYAYGGSGSVTESDHSTRTMVDGTMTMTVDGTQITVYGAGAGIGNSGAMFRIINYTSGDNAGTTAVSGTAEFGGSVKVTGGTVYSYNGTITAEELALAESLGYDYIDAEAIGNGGYSSSNITDDTPYTACAITISGATIYANGELYSSSLSGASITGISNTEYTGKAIAPTPVVKINGTTLKKDQDYTVSYSNNVNVGTATVTITGIGNFSGTRTATFKITAPTVSKSKVTKITVGKRKMKIKVKKVSGATGYQILYRVKGTSKWKTKTITGKTTTTIKSLKKGKKYQVRVIALKKVGSTTFTAAKSAIKVSKAVK